MREEGTIMQNMRTAREDWTVPAAVPAQAVAVTAYRDHDGYMWIRVSADEYVCLDTQLLRAIQNGWRTIPLTEVTAVVGELTPLLPSPDATLSAGDPA